jgi:hypothetical protein
VIAGLAVTCNAMRRQRLGHRDRSGGEAPGRRAASPHTQRRRAPVRHVVIAQQMRHPAERRPSQGGLIGGGVPGVRYTSRFALAVGQNPRRDALCPAQLQHLAGQDRLRVVPSGLTRAAIFAPFRAETRSVTLLALEIGTSREF